MSLCRTCRYGLCYTQKVTEFVVVPAVKEQTMSLGEPAEAWREQEETEDAEQTFFIEDLSKPPVQHAVYHDTVNSLCFWMPTGSSKEPTSEASEVKECNRYEQS